ncbi:unnamed protein product, partial [Closterium sp. NIES-53]
VSMASQIQVASLQGQEDWEEEYRPLPLLFVCSLAIWTVLFGVWIWNTWVKRQWQTSYLQWALALVPALKCVVLSLSFFFWHWCLHFDSCSFWVAFGVFVSRIFFETTCFIMFLLIAHGLGITQDSLSMAQRRSIAGLSGMLYISITAYKAALPHFQIILTGVYTLLLYAIFSNVARRMGALQEQLRQAEAEGAAVEGGAGSALYPALLHRLALFRRFQGAMLAIVFIEIILQTKSDVLGPYWVRLQLREVAEIAVFLFIGWTFRSRVMAPIFMLLPAEQHALPPIHRVDMDDKGFQRLRSKDWTIGICTTSVSSSASGAAGSAGFACNAGAPMVVVVQNPQAASPSLSPALHPNSMPPSLAPSPLRPPAGSSPPVATSSPLPPLVPLSLSSPLLSPIFRLHTEGPVPLSLPLGLSVLTPQPPSIHGPVHGPVHPHVHMDVGMPVLPRVQCPLVPQQPDEMGEQGIQQQGQVL